MIKQGVDSSNGPKTRVAVVPDFHKRICLAMSALLVEWLRQQTKLPFGVKLIHKLCRNTVTSEKLTVWCALWAGGIIGPYFFKNDEGHN
ncbi:hypothetical protein TNCV_3346821, partial [Trichonephila clavipes]